MFKDDWEIGKMNRSKVDKFPHRLSFLSTTICDICQTDNADTTQVSVNEKEKRVGWNICGKESCQKVMREWKAEAIIPEARLTEALGEKVRVMRSSGLMQSGWIISGDAIYSNQEWIITVRLSERELKKIVTLEELELWNNKTCQRP